MNKKRILAGIALTAGLGLTGVATAPVSGAATPQQAQGRTGRAQAAKATADHKGDRRQVVCVIRIGGPGGKGGGRAELPPLPGKPGKPGKGTAGRTTVKVVNGKVYINGKPAPKGTVDTSPKGKCPPPPDLPAKGGKGGKGVVIVERDEGGLTSKGAAGAGAGESGLSTSGAPASAVLG